MYLGFLKYSDHKQRTVRAGLMLFLKAFSYSEVIRRAAFSGKEIHIALALRKGVSKILSRDMNQKEEESRVYTDAERTEKEMRRKNMSSEARARKYCQIICLVVRTLSNSVPPCERG